jgi:AcrR family transcriptional regulator
MRLFLEAIGSILREEGFSGLKVNKIARHTGKDKTLIARYFTNLAGLQRAYIKEKDYWIPIFERFMLTEVDGVAEIKETFVTLMQENFDFFSSNPEMQHIILWQISEQNDLMTGISNDREEYGERLFRLTDPTFEGSDVNFRAVIGLLLGGIYYMVLHSVNNKSKVCGIDLNLQQDKLEILKTIEQVITWACEKADPNEELNQSRYMMNYQFELLETFAAQLSARTDKTDHSVPDAMMVNETKKLSRNIPHHLTGLSNEIQISSYLKMCMTKLAEACDQLYLPGRKFNPDAELVVDLFVSLVKMFSDSVPDRIILPKLFCKKESTLFFEKWQLIKKNMERSKIDPFIIDMVYLPFGSFNAVDRDVRWYHYKYLNMYSSVLETETSEGVLTEQGILDLLIGLGVNHSRLTAHYTKQVKKSCEGLSAINRVKYLSAVQTAIGQIIGRTCLSYDTGKSPVVDELNRWIEMELNRNIAMPEEAPVANPFVLVTNLNAGQLAYWQKLQLDHGIYEESPLDQFSEKISHNFKLRGGANASPSSVKSKFYAKIEVNYKPLEEKLEKMLNEVRLYGS